LTSSNKICEIDIKVTHLRKILLEWN